MGLEYGYLGVGTPKYPALSMPLELMFCMPSQHHTIGLQTGCMVTVLALVVEAARLPRVCPMALGYGLPPCNNNIQCVQGLSSHPTTSLQEGEREMH